jgi:hypothetical protein
VSLDKQVHKERLARQVRLVLVCKARLDKQDRKERLEIPDHKAILVVKERQVKQVHREQLVTQDRKVQQV